MARPSRKKATHRARSLDPDQLYQACDPALLPFKTTAELPDLSETIGQLRAVEALRFGVSVRHPGYNIFILGPAGSGRYSLALKELQDVAAREPAALDWCYVNNFEQPHKPEAISLPTGRGEQLQRHMRQFAEELGSVVPAAFDSPEYHSRVEAINEEFKQRQEQALEAFGKTAQEHGIALIQTPTGFALAPIKEGAVVTPDDFEHLPAEEQQRLNDLIQRFDEELHQVVHQFPRWRREHQTRLREFNRETIGLAVGHLIDELRQHYADLPKVRAFLDATLADIIENAGELREPGASEALTGVATLNPLQRYQANLLVDAVTEAGAPVIFENHPTYQNLIGRIEHIAHMGTLVTNFSLIKPGALHRANGGYLILDAGKLLVQPYAWEGLKRALQSHEIRIESLGEIFGFANTLSLQPQPIPLQVKLVLFGERLFYYLLCQLDPDFTDLFKVAADFEEDMARNPENTQLYARLIATLVRRQELRPFDASAVGRLIEHASRLAGDSGKLLIHARSMNDLLVEAAHFAQVAQRGVVGRDDVQQAIDAQIHRADRLRQRHLERILEGTFLIDTSGNQAGQVNGLAVVSLGDYQFAHPVRITATTRLGEGSVIDIEREVELGGAIHSKGVLILSSFLAARYSHSTPLSLNASLVFEQSYGGVEGDSASLAELCALLSALSGLPVHQGFAITGSVNQIGQVQAIGAVNEKIEGFFDVCRERGLTGKQGVLVPVSNVRHLMLRQDVRDAVAAGQFHIHAVQDVDEAIELLTGVPAGKPDALGVVPEGSVNYLVASQLLQLSLMRKAYGTTAREARGTRSRAAAKRGVPKR
ncbi:MAG: Lon protease family protein [Betaproteobacteria bacterium]|nr:Lon protease family protein [Betaproteobacteria bacterium]